MTDASQTQSDSRNAIARLFLDHPASVDESYFEHMRFAFTFAFWLGLAASAALIHAVLPFACETTASRIVKRLHTRITNRASAH
jgi:hypothetical protein